MLKSDLKQNCWFIKGVGYVHLCSFNFFLNLNSLLRLNWQLKVLGFLGFLQVFEESAAWDICFHDIVMIPTSRCFFQVPSLHKSDESNHSANLFNRKSISHNSTQFIVVFRTEDAAVGYGDNRTIVTLWPQLLVILTPPASVAKDLIKIIFSTWSFF